MHDNQLKAIIWINSGMKYTEGVDLLVDLTSKQSFYNLFTGKDKSLPDTATLEAGIRVPQGAQEIIDAFTKTGSARPELLKTNRHWLK